VQELVHLRVAIFDIRPRTLTGRALGLAVVSDQLCERLAAWHDQYPNPSATARENAAARADEDQRLSGFAGLDELDRGQAAELVAWKFQAMPHRRKLAMAGISLERWTTKDGVVGAGTLIRRALAETDDYEALATMARRIGGISHFGPAMSSVILTACRPLRYTVADSRALKALRDLGLLPFGTAGFRLDDWIPYLEVCRTLSDSCGMTLRQVDRALWVGGG
jgi:hypothetical protein